MSALHLVNCSTIHPELNSLWKWRKAYCNKRLSACIFSNNTVLIHFTTDMTNLQLPYRAHTFWNGFILSSEGLTCCTIKSVYVCLSRNITMRHKKGNNTLGKMKKCQNSVGTTEWLFKHTVKRPLNWKARVLSSGTLEVLQPVKIKGQVIFTNESLVTA